MATRHTEICTRRSISRNGKFPVNGGIERWRLLLWHDAAVLAVETVSVVFGRASSHRCRFGACAAAGVDPHPDVLGVGPLRIAIDPATGNCRSFVRIASEAATPARKDAAGLSQCFRPRLPKTGVVRLAGAGAAQHPIRAFLAQAERREGAAYTKPARRGKLADDGAASLPWPTGDQTSSKRSASPDS